MATKQRMTEDTEGDGGGELAKGQKKYDIKTSVQKLGKTEVLITLRSCSQ